ncbi:hypothetical protein C8R44DRAFT_974265 [Mycena epipterygia]|nr:hypothetical protein C8R44DRAFT_974265 [Mycena epipterygia]
MPSVFIAMPARAGKGGSPQLRLPILAKSPSDGLLPATPGNETVIFLNPSSQRVADIERWEHILQYYIVTQDGPSLRKALSSFRGLASGASVPKSKFLENGDHGATHLCPGGAASLINACIGQYSLHYWARTDWFKYVQATQCLFSDSTFR